MAMLEERKLIFNYQNNYQCDNPELDYKTFQIEVTGRERRIHTKITYLDSLI